MTHNKEKLYKWRAYHIYGLDELILLRFHFSNCSINSKQKQSHSQSQEGFFRNCQDRSKIYMKKQMISNILIKTIFKKKYKVRRIALLYTSLFMTYYKQH